MPLTTLRRGSANPVSRSQPRGRCGTCGHLRVASAFTRSKPHTNCSTCRRLYAARTGGRLAEAELLEKYGPLDDFLSVGLGRRWPQALTACEQGFYRSDR
jgi:ribosomal protein S27E